MKIAADGRKSLAEVAEPLTADELSAGRMEDRVEFDDVAFDSAGHRADLIDPAYPGRISAQVTTTSRLTATVGTTNAEEMFAPASR